MRIVNFIFLLLGLLASCQSPKEKAKGEEKFGWNAGISAPKNYIATPFVEYFYQGKSVAGTSTNVGTGQGWGITSGGYTGGDNFKPVPDSVFVKWSCGFDLITYQGGFRLPRKKMLELFNKGTIDPYNGQNEEYSVLVAGTAPGGNITIWMKSGPIITEIVKFKAENKGIYKEGGREHQKIMNAIYNSKEFINSEANIFRYFHGIPYKIWETGEKEYNYDIGFSTEEESKKDYSIAILGYTKDGSLVYSNKDPIPYTKWNKNLQLKVSKNKKLPLQLWIRWHSKDGEQWYEAQVILPNNFRSQVLQFQKQYEKDTFVVIGMDKVLNNESYSFGRIWLENSKGKKDIMKFRAAKFNLQKNDFEVSQFSLPKDFVFPKWEKGKEPLRAPDVDYWKEK